MAAPLATVAVKVGAEVAKDPKKAGQFVLYIVIGIFAFIFFLAAVIGSFFSALFGEDLDADFEISSSQIYQDIDGTYQEYLEFLEESMDEREAELLEQYEKKGIEVKIVKQINRMNYAYIFAYLTQRDDAYKYGDPVVYDSDGVLAFMKQLGQIYMRTMIPKAPTEGIPATEDPLITEIVLYNGVPSPTEAAAFMSADETVQEAYLISFDMYTDFLGSEGINISGLSLYDTSLSFIDGKELADRLIEIPTYYQNDFRSTPYGSGSIATTGCAPTSIAMVLSYLRGEEITPVDVVRYVGNKYYVKGSGSSWSIFPACATKWKVSCTDLGYDIDSLLAAVKNGDPVIASMGAGTFTSSGHIIVITGITEDGFFIVNDPNKSNFTKYKTNLFSINLVFKEAKNFWKYSN